MKRKIHCSDCETAINRRTFINAVGGATVAGVASPMLLDLPELGAAPRPTSAAETTVTEFYNSLTDRQLFTICFPFDHPLRHRINANWHITDPLIGSGFYSKQQQALIEMIVQNITSEDGYQRLRRQMDEDSGGLESYSVALFGEPGRGKFQWELTGRHLTLRADGDSVDKAAFGGPIVYGHSESSPTDNLYHFQSKKTNEVFHSLDGAQARKALLPRAPRETAVSVQGSSGAFQGIPVGDLSDDQKELVEETIKVLLGPFRSEDVDEVMTILKTSGGFDNLHMAFYQQGDLRNDHVWDMWRVEGPSFVWHFRGAPHVHAYINIGLNQQNQSESGSQGRRGRGRRPRR